HENGDRVLIEIASRWKALADSQNTGTRDFIARLSGDDFSIIIRNYESGEKITETINAYEAELEKKITVEDCDFFLSAFFGFAEYPYDSNDSMVLFSHADAALHEVQRLNTGSRIFRFNPKLLKNEQDLEIERKIRTALENDRILFHLQPQYTTEHKLRGFEALARIKDNDGTFISPADFIPVAENAGLIDRIDIQVLKKAVTFLSDILKQQDTDIVICVNISVRHLMKNNFIEEIKEIIYSSIVNPNRFEFEITESIMIDSAETALQRIDELKKMGIKIAIDDVGTGYSSLSYLYKLPADILKIDKSFIDVMNADESSKKYVSTIISIGHILNLEVVSEGVETEEQLKTLKETGCDYIQGYVWGRPVPPEEAAKLIPD
ncbi:MAG: EAL domain-containing protein, partial [Treponema sp.]|nr:EAL domain-containing protein [Treponema sp.]